MAVFVFSLKGTGLCWKGNEGMPGSDFRMGWAKGCLGNVWISWVRERLRNHLGHSDHLGTFRSFDYIWITLRFGGTWIPLGSFDYTWMTLNDYIEGRIVCI